jgi:hypothetical protein
VSEGFPTGYRLAGSEQVENSRPAPTAARHG